MQKFFEIQRKKIFIQANCQGDACKHIFSRINRLNEKYEILDIKPVHLWQAEDKYDIFSKLETADIFLHQPVSEVNFGIYGSDNLKRHLKQDVKLISFPNLFFTGYHPQAIYLRDTKGLNISEPYDYHDKNLVEMFKAGKSVDEVEYIAEDESYYSTDVIRQNIDNSLVELKERESLLDIKVADYIENNMFGKKLFHIFNHPINELIFVLFDMILEILGEQPLAVEEKAIFKNEILGIIQIPVYKSVRNYLNLCDEARLFIYKQENIPNREVLEAYFKIYHLLLLPNDN